jgi:hypothetical protein
LLLVYPHLIPFFPILPIPHVPSIIPSRSFTVTYPSKELAQIAHATVTVDQDIREGRFSRQFVVDGADLTVTFVGPDAKAMRVAVGGIVEMLGLSTKTMALYGGAK